MIPMLAFILDLNGRTFKIFLNASYLKIHILFISLKDGYNMDVTPHPARFQTFRFVNELKNNIISGESQFCSRCLDISFALSPFLM